MEFANWYRDGIRQWSYMPFIHTHVAHTRTHGSCSKWKFRL